MFPDVKPLVIFSGGAASTAFARFSGETGSGVASGMGSGDRPRGFLRLDILWVIRKTAGCS